MAPIEQAKRLSSLGGQANGNAFIGLMALAGLVGWVVVWFGALAWGYLGVERGAVRTLPTAVWVVLTAVATALNVYAAAGVPAIRDTGSDDDGGVVPSD